MANAVAPSRWPTLPQQLVAALFVVGGKHHAVDVGEQRFGDALGIVLDLVVLQVAAMKARLSAQALAAPAGSPATSCRRRNRPCAAPSLAAGCC
jgi:hypothetical protein